ncbi:MAG: siderophore-interacting protein [Xanthobacter sp.]
MAVEALRHQFERVRHGIKRRTLTVVSILDITPHMRRITFSCKDMDGFQSPSADDHIKLFLGHEANGEECMRDYTPRYYDLERKLLVIDFAMHETGVATNWARQAQSGMPLEIAGPRGSVIVPDDFDYYLLVGDETALPAIGRRLETMRPGVPVTVVCLVQNAVEIQGFRTRADLNVIWLYRSEGKGDDATRFLKTLEGWCAPQGDGFVWIAAEAMAARDVKNYILNERGHNAQWLKSSGYWVQGAAGASEK